MHPRRRNRPFVGGVVVVAVLCGVATFHWVRPEAPAPAAGTVGSLTAVEPIVIATPSPLTAEGIEQFRSDLHEYFGDAVVDEAHLSTTLITFAKAPAGSPNRVVPFTYRSGIDASDDPVTRDVNTPVFDLATLNVPLIAQYLAGAPQSTGVPDGTVNGISLRTTETGNIVQISVSNTARESGSLVLAPDGKLLSVREFTP